MSRLYLLLLLASAPVLEVLAMTDSQITNHWPGGFNGQIMFQVPQEVTGWKLHIIFDRPVTSVTTGEANVDRVSEYEFNLSNKDWNAHLQSGFNMNININGQMVGNDWPTHVCSYFDGLEDDSVCPRPFSTTPKTTTTIQPAYTGPPTAGTTPVPTPWPTSGFYVEKDYQEALRLSLLFYYAQRSGKLPADNPIPWRNDSALTDCVVGGWYDDGDHVKYTFPMAGALTMLLWGLERFQDGYQTAGQLDAMYDTVKWGLDYLLEAWDPFTRELVVQVGEAGIDQLYWGRPEDMQVPRPCLKIGPGRHGSDVAGETVAALAAGALVFREKGDLEYAAQLLSAAESLYSFAEDNRGKFADNPPMIGDAWVYGSEDDRDEMCEAAAWLYKATGEEDYLVDAKNEHEGQIPTELSWDDKMDACHLLLYNITGNTGMRRDVENFLRSWQPNGTKVYSPCGFVWQSSTNSGSARHAANVAFAALLAAEDGIDPEVNRKWAVEQLNYLLGDNPHDGGCFSYEIGYGNKYPQQPHHRAASCPDPPANCTEANLHVDAPNPHILLGGLVGGPDWFDRYNDTRIDEVHNEVAVDYNAGFQSALAGIVHLGVTGQMPRTENMCPCYQ